MGLGDKRGSDVSREAYGVCGAINIRRTMANTWGVFLYKIRSIRRVGDDRLILWGYCIWTWKKVCKRSFMPKASITCMKEEIPEV